MLRVLVLAVTGSATGFSFRHASLHLVEHAQASLKTFRVGCCVTPSQSSDLHACSGLQSYVACSELSLGTWLGPEAAKVFSSSQFAIQRLGPPFERTVTQSFGTEAFFRTWRRPRVSWEPSCSRASCRLPLVPSPRQGLQPLRALLVQRLETSLPGT